MRRILFFLTLASLPWMLGGCENDGAAYQIDGRNHTISLVREQAMPWSSEINQALVVARFPQCQRRTAIHASPPSGFRLELWWIRDHLYVARDGTRWYAIGTEKCQVQKMEPTGASPPGQLLGHFQREKGVLSFEATPEDKRATP
jgi:hypothetical protein